MTTRTQDNVWITLADGSRLAARLWMPEDAEARPVPAILEYLPYRKDDGTAAQDATRHPYFARHGYAAVRVDICGTGDSDGILCDEYLKQEQDDALEVIAWIAKQPWCSGAVGMIGYSWGGFNGLQVAARRPPELKAIVTAYSTDDRYTDDCHYMGGCLLGSDMLKWASSMRVYNALPPDPRFRNDWREVWLKRLRETPAYIEPWLSHQTYDAFWKQGSVAEDYSAIQAATLVVGGWADPYTNAVPRLLSRLTCERKGFIGPWAHILPYGGVPGPAVGFLAECVRWFDRWLKGIETGVERDPLVRAWIQETAAPATFYAERPGRWVALDEWPAEGTNTAVWRFGEERALVREGGRASAAARVIVQAPQHTGVASGVWCPNGMADELPADQRVDDALSVCFDSAPLEEPLEALGAPVVRLRVSADSDRALVVVRLCEVAPDGASTLVSWGMLNLTHRNGHEDVRLLEQGVPYDVTVGLNVIGHRFSVGSVVRIAVSQAYWPHAWPSPGRVHLSLHVSGCALEMAMMPDAASDLVEPFGPPENEGGTVHLREGSRTRTVRSGPGAAMHVIEDVQVSERELETGTRFASRSEDRWEIAEHDPLSARATAVREDSLEREGWRVRALVHSTLTATATTFLVEDELTAFEGDVPIFSDRRRFEIPRNGV